MSKSALIVLFSLLTISQVSCKQFFQWESCQDQLKAYSIYYNSFTKDVQEQLDQQHEILFNCPNIWFSPEGQKQCETTNGLSSTDASVQAYYKDCIVPEAAYQHGHCTIKSECASEKDKCSACMLDTTCSTNMKYGMQNYLNTEKDNLLNEIYNEENDANCSDKNKFKTLCVLDTLKQTAFNECNNYYTNKCQEEFFEANFSSDPCYGEIICRNKASGYLMKICFIAIIAFFTF